MKLTKEQEDILNGKEGEFKQGLMRLLVDWGTAMKAERMVPVTNVQPNNLNIPGSNLADTYKSLDVIMAGVLDQCSYCAKVKATTHISTCNIELPGLDSKIPAYAKKMIDATRPNGLVLTWSCTPYLISNVPMPGERCCWTESHAVIFINSMLGARSTRNGAESSYAAAILGIAPEFGVMLDEGRKGNLIIDIQTELEDPIEWGALGYFIGKKADLRIPVITGGHPISIEAAQQLCSAMASSGGVTMFHMVGVTPEARTLKDAVGDVIPEERYVFGKRELEETIESLREFHDEKVDFVYLGCPHTTLYKIAKISQMLEGKKIHQDVYFELYTQYGIRENARRLGYIDVIEKAGGKVYVDTCSCNMDYLNNRTMLTDSVKQAHYARGTINSRAALETTENCVKAAIEGRWSAK